MGIRIKQLSAAVANQIAAGEVIDRPASVVKELLENAYDAGATSIQVELAYGGLNQIIISDNGHGIFAEDLPLTIQAHATSKIENAEDLYQVSSMGFRGEALASIASVARLSISSKTSEEAHATKLTVEQGQVQIQSCARNVGTSIAVNDLFYNLPVRKKFLKSERIEYLAVESVVKCFALSAPQIAIQLKHNGKISLSLPSASNDVLQHQRIVKLFGQAFADSAIYLDVERANMQISGWLSNVDYQRSQNDRIWIYINQRMVKDKLIQHAIKQAYEDILHPGRFPACLLYFKIPVNEVDVNVHPAKHEVRFESPRLVHDFFVSQLKSALPSTSDSYLGTKESVLKEPLKVREPSWHFPSQSNVYMNNNCSDWFILNKKFVILRVDKQTLIINFQKFQQRRLLEQLKQIPMPLASRKLLVPVSYQVEAASYGMLSDKQSALEAIGLKVELLDQNKIKVHSIPVAMPQLDLSEFLASFAKLKSFDNDSLMTHMILCQSHEPQQLSQEEKLAFKEEVQCQLSALLAEGLCQILSEERCEILLND
jgi:DNA mismatch repair protein MutL